MSQPLNILKWNGSTEIIWYMKDECFINTFEDISRDFYALSTEFMNMLPLF